MSRSLRRIGALGACVTAVVAFGAPSSFAATAQDRDFTLYAKEVPTEEEGQEEGRQPPRVGESFSFADDLYRTKGGEKVGRDGVTCTVVRGENPSDVLCVGTFVVSGDLSGQLTGQVLQSFDPSSQEEPAGVEIAVTGGTGDFRDARGTVHSSPDGDYERLEFRIND